MHILLVSYLPVTSCFSAHARTYGIVKALVDCGHVVDLVAPAFDVETISMASVTMLSTSKGEGVSGRLQLRITMRNALLKKRYDAVHAVDDAVFAVRGLCRIRRIPLIYDARRRLSGSLRKVRLSWVGRRYLKQEKLVLEQAELVLSFCSMLTSDLKAILPGKARLAEFENVPLQLIRGGSLYSQQEPRGTDDGPRIFCNCLGKNVDMRSLLLAVHKVVDVIPKTTFCVRSSMRQEKAKQMAACLDVGDNCEFISDTSPDYLESLRVADALLLVPDADARYLHPEVYTMLFGNAPLVAVQDKAYASILNELNCVEVLANTDAISEGLLQVLQEPLFAQPMAQSSRKKVFVQHTFSSFKHHVRMAYYQLSR